MPAIKPFLSLAFPIPASLYISIAQAHADAELIKARQVQATIPEVRTCCTFLPVNFISPAICTLWLPHIKFEPPSPRHARCLLPFPSVSSSQQSVHPAFLRSRLGHHLPGTPVAYFRFHRSHHSRNLPSKCKLASTRRWLDRHLLKSNSLKYVRWDVILLLKRRS